MSLSPDLARDQIRKFLRLKGQPIDEEALRGILLTEEQIARRFDQNLLQSSVNRTDYGGDGNLSLQDQQQNAMDIDVI